MSIGEGDPYTSAFASAQILEDRVIHGRDSFPPPWLVKMNEAFQLNLSLEGPSLQKETIAGQLRDALFHQIESRTTDFWVLQPYCEEALHVPEHKRVAFIQRQRQVASAIERWAIKTAKSIAIECGTEAFSYPENKAAITEVFQQARIEALKEVGVLTPEGEIVSGQEKFVPAGFVLPAPKNP